MKQTNSKRNMNAYKNEPNRQTDRQTHAHIKVIKKKEIKTIYVNINNATDKVDIIPQYMKFISHEMVVSKVKAENEIYGRSETFTHTATHRTS